LVQFSEEVNITVQPVAAASLIFQIINGKFCTEVIKSDVMILWYVIVAFRKQIFAIWLRKYGIVRVFLVPGMTSMTLFWWDGITKKNGRLGIVFF